MTLLARGDKEVRALELALGGKPPGKAAQQSLALLKRHVQERFERRKANWAKMRPLLERSQAPLIKLIKNDPGAVESMKKRRKIMLAGGKQKLTHKHLRAKVDPRMVSGSGFWLKAPPYDESFENVSGFASASANANTGAYSLNMGGDGSSSAASAGVGMWFFATDEDPQQRVAALAQYDFSWLDSSTWYTAHNDGSTNIWVWGNSEQNWVLQAGNFFPNWSDGTGWLETHGSGGDGSEQFGTESFEAFFPAAANSWYFAWVWSEGSCDDNSGSIFGFSFAQQAQSMALPFVVFGEI
jgi:hypothetical protein